MGLRGTALALAALGAAAGLVLLREDEPAGRESELAVAPVLVVGPAFAPRAAYAPTHGAPVPAGIAQAAEREFAVRAAVRRGLSDGGAAVIEDVRSPDRATRVVALEALARLASLGRVADTDAAARSLPAAARDPHPNVRAAAVIAAQELELADAFAADAPLLDALAADPLAETRRATAEILGAVSDGRAEDVLDRLLQDPAPEVRRAAATSLALRLAAETHSGPLDSAPAVRVLDLAARHAVELQGAELADERYAYFRDLERARLPAVALDALLARLPPHDGERPAGSSAGSKWWDPANPDVALREIHAMTSALAYAAGGRGDLDALLRAWFASDRWDPARMERFEIAFHSRDEQLGDALLAIVVRLLDPQITFAPSRGVATASALAPFWEWNGTLRRQDAAAMLAAGALDVLGRGGFLQRMRCGGETEWRTLTRHTSPWTDEDVARALACTGAGGVPEQTPRLLVAALHAAAYAGDSAATAGLARLLSYPRADVRDEAFAAIASAADASEHHDTIAAYAMSLPRPERYIALRRLVGRPPIAALRGEVLALGDEGGFHRELATDLLRSYVGDEEVALRASMWAFEECAALGDDDATARPRVERRVVMLLQALEQIAPREAVDAAREALVASLGRSPSVGRAAAAVLGKSPEGRTVLREHLGAGTDRATRLEVAAALAAAGEGLVAVDALVGAFAHAPSEQQVRLVQVFGAIEDPRVDAFYAALALGELPDGTAADPIVRLGAIAILERRGGDHAPLRDLVRGARDLDVTMAAIRALGWRRDVDGVVALWNEFGRGAPVEPRIPWPPRAIESRDAVRSELLAALARSGAFDARAGARRLPIDVWLAEPLAWSGHDLLRRFAVEPMSPADFRWRAELDVARALSERGVAADALAASGEIERLDGRLLLDLAHALRPRSGALPPFASEVAELAVAALAAEPAEARAAHARALVTALEHALAEADHARAARIAARLERGLRRDEFSTRSVEGVLESASPSRGSDPLARVAALAEQSRARAALVAGDLDRAHRHGARAQRLAAPSKAAGDEQARLEAELGRATRR